PLAGRCRTASTADQAAEAIALWLSMYSLTLRSTSGLVGSSDFFASILFECLTIGYPEAAMELEVVAITERVCGPQDVGYRDSSGFPLRWRSSALGCIKNEAEPTVTRPPTQ